MEAYEKFVGAVIDGRYKIDKIIGDWRYGCSVPSI